ncbi:MAG: hypothetical protein K2P80_12225 [Beijerinckiaceae bacterium]|nr:hypothetical protein [Beijerinckiaceae bacterium]
MRYIGLVGVSVAALFATSLPAAAGCQGSGCYQQVVHPPVYATEHQQYLVAPERRIAHRTPAEYQTVHEEVLVQPERQIPHHIPAEYSTVAETVLVAPASRQWQVSVDAYGRTVGCWVDVPAQYATRHRQVVVRPASVEYETIPAVTRTRPRIVQTRPASVEVEVQPAQYETVARRVQVAPASASWQPIGGRSARRSCGNGGLFGSYCGE